MRGVDTSEAVQYGPPQAEGGHPALEWRYADGRFERLKSLAQELVTLGVDLIHAVGPEAITAAKNATSLVPIVGVGGADPVSAGWAASLARPGANLTGFTAVVPGLGPKNLALLKEAAPRIKRVAAFHDATHLTPTSPMTPGYVTELENAARQLGLHIQFFGLESAKDVTPSFASARRWGAEAVHMTESAWLLNERPSLAGLVARHRMPSIAFIKAMSDAGFLLAHGPDIADLHRRSAMYVGKILKGEKPGTLPFQQPSKFDLSVNLKTAQALGLSVHPSLLLRADYVIR